MSRLKELRKVVGDKLRESITDAEKLEKAYAHLYGVSLAATVIAEKRGENSELASMSAMLHDIAAYVNGSYDDQKSCLDMPWPIQGKLIAFVRLYTIMMTNW